MTLKISWKSPWVNSIICVIEHPHQPLTWDHHYIIDNPNHYVSYLTSTPTIWVIQEQWRLQIYFVLEITIYNGSKDLYPAIESSILPLRVKWQGNTIMLIIRITILLIDSGSKLGYLHATQVCYPIHHRLTSMIYMSHQHRTFWSDAVSCY